MGVDQSTENADIVPDTSVIVRYGTYLKAFGNEGALPVLSYVEHSSDVEGDVFRSDI
jgi:hypothetical protein